MCHTYRAARYSQRTLAARYPHTLIVCYLYYTSALLKYINDALLEFNTNSALPGYSASSVLLYGRGIGVDWQQLRVRMR